MTTSGSIRASDADREQVVEILREQTAQGRLTLEELSDRTDAAYTAATWQDLSTLTEDLPVEMMFERDERRPVGYPPAQANLAEDRLPERAGDDRLPVGAPAWRMLLACCCWLGVGSPGGQER
jgi:Domain of unknown function (DUF1707)